MRYLRFVVGLLVIIAALALQFWGSSFGININFALAALIVCAFFFDFSSLLILILFSIFVLNWEPAITWDLVLFAMIPILAFLFHKIVHWHRWAAAPIAIIVGLFLLYLGLAPGMFLHNILAFLEDIVGAVVFGGVVLWIMALLRFP